MKRKQIIPLCILAIYLLVGCASAQTSQAPTETPTVKPATPVVVPSITPTVTATNQYSAEKIIGIASARGGYLLYNDSLMPVFTLSRTFHCCDVSFSSDGCIFRTVNDFMVTNGFSIQETDIFGNNPREYVVRHNETPPPGGVYHQFTISPSGDWLAYKLATDIRMGAEDADTQDVFLLAVNNQAHQDAVLLTVWGGGGHNKIVWAKDSTFIAYTDYDGQGVMQIFVYYPEQKEKRQITYFSSEIVYTDQEIIDIKISPDNSYIVFTWLAFREDQSGYEIVSLLGNELKWIEFPDFQNPRAQNINFRISYLPWWSQDSRTLLLSIEADTDGKPTDYLIWYDIATDQITHLLSAADLFDNRLFNDAFPITSADKVGIVSWDMDVILYDVISQTTIALEQAQGNIPYFEIVPMGYIDLEACSRIESPE